MPLSRRAKRRLLLLSILVVLIVVGGVGARQVLRWRQEQILQATRSEGIAASRAGNHERAISLLGSVFRSMRDDHEVAFALATSRFEVPLQDDGHLGASAALFARCAELRADDVESRRRLLEIYPKLGFLREALDAADEVLAVDPLDAKARETRIQILASLGRWSEAAEECASMVAKDPGDAQWKRLELSLALASGATPTVVLELTEQWPASPQGDGLDDLLRAVLLQSMGRSDEANALVEAAVRLGAADQERFDAMTSILSDLGRSSLAWEMMEGSLDRSPASAEEIAEQATDFAFRFGDLTRLGAILEALPEGSPKRARVLSRIVLMEVGSSESSDREKSTSLLEQVRPSGDSPEAVVLSAARLRRQFDRAEHRRIMELAKNEKADFAVLLAAAHAATWIGDSSSALQLTARAEERQPTLAGGVLLANLQAQSGQYEKAVEGTLQLLGRFGGHPAVIAMLCRLWNDSPALTPTIIDQIRLQTGFQSPLEAAEALTEAVGLDPYTGPILAASAVQQGRWDVVEDVVVDAVSRRPIQVPYLLDILDRLEGVAPELAGRVAGTLLELAPGDPLVIAKLGTTGSESLSELRKAFPLDAEPEEVRRQAWIALLAASGGLDAGSFVELANEAVDRYPTDPQLLNLLLGEPRSWSSEDLVKDLIARLEPIIGAESSTLLVAQANLLLTFRPDDRRAMEGLIVRFSDLVSRQPESLVAGITLMRLLASDPGSDPQSIIRLGRRILSQHPTALELYPFVIEQMQAQGMLEESEALLRQFELRDASMLASKRQRARQSWREGDLQQLVLVLADLAVRSKSSTDQLELARAREAVGDFAAAEQAYRKVLEDPEAPNEALLRLAALLARQGRLSEAEALIAEGSLGFSDGRREMVMGALLLNSGDREGALRSFRRAVELLPDDGEAWRLLATTEALAGQDKAALDAALAGLQRLQTSEELMGLVIGAALRDGAALRQLIAAPAFRELPDVVQECARILERSMDAATNTLQPDPEDLRLARDLCGRRGNALITWRTAMALHAAVGQTTESRALASAAARAHPSAPEPYEWQVRMAAALGEVDEAIRLCRDWRRVKFPDVESVDQMQAMLELARKRADLAMELLRPYAGRIAGTASDQPGPYRTLLGAMIMSGDVKGAVRLEGARLAASPNARDVWARLAFMAPYEPGLEAMSFLEAATPATARDRAAMIGTWISFYDRHPEGQGLQRAKALLPRGELSYGDPDSRLLQVASADIAKASGDSPGMQRTLQTVIDSIAAEDWAEGSSIITRPPAEQAEIFEEIEAGIYARNNLAMLLVEENRDLDKALRLVDECLAVVPDEVNLLDSKAQVLLALGRFSEAEAELLKAIRLQPSNPTLLLTAAQILAGSGRNEEADQLVNRVQDLVAQEPWPSKQLEDRLRRVREIVRG